MRHLLAAALAAVALCGLAARADGPSLVLDSEIEWRSDWKDFGGFSGLVVRPGGRDFVAISDQGSWASGSFDRRDGRLRGARIGDRGHLRAIDGSRLKVGDHDAEGLAIDDRGRAYVSYEGFHRVRRYDDLGGPADEVPSHPDFAELQDNSGLEALAIDAGGTLYAIPERSGALDRPFPVYRLVGDRWEKGLTLRRDGRFLPVDADFGPDGKLYLLERDFTWLGGFATRVRRFELGPDGFGEEVALLESGFGELDNMEGISVWRDDGGGIRVTLISDDNFFPLQRNIFAEYLLAGE
jgi:hypothetical protein